MVKRETANVAKRPAATNGTAPTPKVATAKRAATKEAASLARPEKSSAESPPDPNYPLYRIAPGSNVTLSDVNADESEHYTGKRDVAEELDRQRMRIRDLQERLYAERQRSLLIVLQAMDTGGKDGTIRGVFQGVNPQGCQVWSFKAPSTEEMEHDFLWRYHLKAPSRGLITIFNRSHYEEVLIVRVKNLMPEDVWRRRYAMINEFEQMLSLNNTTIIKFYLHISKEEQKQRLQSRLDDDSKHWKFSSADLKERAYWDQYMAAFEEAVENCSTEVAPWYVVPSNKKWYRNLVIARTIADTLDAMNPRFPNAEKGLAKLKIAD